MSSHIRPCGVACALCTRVMCHVTLGRGSAPACSLPRGGQVCAQTAHFPGKASDSLGSPSPLPLKGHIQKQKINPCGFITQIWGLLVTIELAPSCHWTTCQSQTARVRLPQLSSCHSVVRDSFKGVRLHKYIYTCVCVCVYIYKITSLMFHTVSSWSNNLCWINNKLIYKII